MSELGWRPFGVDCRGAASGVQAVVGDGEKAFSAYVPLPCVVAIGVFDGVHRGHQELLRATVGNARARGVASVALTFDPDPAEVLGTSGASTRLLGTADRVAGLYAQGIDAVVVLPFTAELARLSPQRFVEETIMSRLSPVSVHVGENFRFGYRGQGTPATLAKLGERLGFVVHAHGLFELAGGSVSATRIRALLATPGELDAANELLGRAHYVRGSVAHGRGEGTSFGFPTANVVADVRDCMPAEGVYACYVTSGNRAWPAAANVGAPPTFSAAKPAFLEANLIGFEGDLYDERLAVSFVRWLRPSRRFDSLAELERVVLGNIDWVRQNLGDHEIALA